MTLDDLLLTNYMYPRKRLKVLHIVHNRVGEEYSITKPLYFVHPFDIILDVGGNGNIDEIEIPQSLVDPSPPSPGKTGKTGNEGVDFISTDIVYVSVSTFPQSMQRLDIMIFSYSI